MSVTLLGQRKLLTTRRRLIGSVDASNVRDVRRSELTVQIHGSDIKRKAKSEQ